MSDKPPFIDEVIDVAAFLARDQVVQTDSSTQAYGILKALAWHPRVRVATELFFADASAILVTVGNHREDVRANPETMGFDPAYWANKLDAYPRWETAWWREVVQNARDAKATRVTLESKVELYTTSEGTTVEAIRCSCHDNGSGMDEGTLRKAFLTFGGSQKEAGAVGGFGDAKELIIIPWLGYEIRTRDLVAKGQHNTFDIAPAEKPLEGTKVSVWMPKEKATTEVYARAFLERCNLPTIAFTSNGTRVKADQAGGELVDEQPISTHGGRQVGTLRIFHNSRAKRRGVLIRSNGLFMYEKYVPEGQYAGIVYIELEGSPRDLFDQKRVQFSYRTNVQELVDRFIAALTVDQTALKKRNKGKERKFYGGSGALKVRAGHAAEVAASLSKAAPIPDMKAWKDGGFSFTDEAVAKMTRALEETVTSEPKPTGYSASDQYRYDRVETNVGAVGVMLQETKFVGADHAANAMRLMAWEPAFLLVNEVDFYVVPNKARPEGMSPTYKTLLTLWAEICRFVLMRLGWTEPFGVGYIFSWDRKTGMTSLAAHTEEEGIHFLMLNPFKLKVASTKRDAEGDTVDVKYDEEERWKTSDDETLKMLCAAAIHEATHMVNGISEHNESFAAALTENMGAMLDMLPVTKKIRAAVASRKARAERRPAAEQVASTEMRGDTLLVRTPEFDDAGHSLFFMRLFALWVAANERTWVDSTYVEVLRGVVLQQEIAIRHFVHDLREEGMSGTLAEIRKFMEEHKERLSIPRDVHSTDLRTTGEELWQMYKDKGGEDPSPSLLLDLVIAMNNVWDLSPIATPRRMIEGTDLTKWMLVKGKAS